MFITHCVGHYLILRYELNYLVEGGDYGIRLASIAVTSLLYLCSFLVLRRFVYQCSIEQLTWPQIVLMVFAALPAIYINNLVTLSMRETDESWARSWMPVFVEAVSCVSGLVVVVGNEAIASLKQARSELDHAQRVIEMQYARYVNDQAMMDDVNKKYHDIKRRVDALSQLGSADLRKEYVRSLEEEISQLHPVISTGNEILDTIIADKARECDERCITLTCMVDGTLLSFMKLLDVTAIVANLIDNSIQAVDRYDGELYREISLKVAKNESGMILICVENPYNDSLPDGIVTIQMLSRGRARKGYGVRNILAAVERYSGNMAMRAEGETFRTVIAIPEPRQSEEKGDA